MTSQLDTSSQLERPASYASLSRDSFLERVRSVLQAPLPECLEHRRQSNCSTTLPPTEASRLVRLLHPAHEGHHGPLARLATRKGAGSGEMLAIHTETGNSTSTRTSEIQLHRPFYERLLEEGRLAAERREQLTMRAVEAEMADLRPALSLPPNYKPKPLPPDGQRIEDKLLQRAREHAELLERKREEAQKRRDEELRATAPFKPRISSHAKETQAKYKRVPQDFEAWRARRKQELDDARKLKLLSEEANHREIPDINPHSAKLAARRKRREQEEGSSFVGGVPPPSGSQAQPPRQRSRSRHDSGATTGQPAISEFASRLDRPGSVSDRLYADASAFAQRRLERQQEQRVSTPFRPSITSKAAASTPRYRSVEQQQQQQQEQQLATDSATRSLFRPVIDPVSEAIARRLPESSRERLQRPAHCLGGSRSAEVEEGEEDSYLRENLSDGWSADSGDVAYDGFDRAMVSPRTRRVAPLPPHVADAFAFYEHRRKERLRELRLEQETRLQGACTFAPQTNVFSQVRGNASGDSDDDNVARRSHQWLTARERRLEQLRTQQRREEREEARRCARWREETGLFADRPRPSFPGQVPCENEQVPADSNHCGPRDQRCRAPRGPRAESRQSSLVGDDSSRSPPSTLSRIYSNVYHVDPTPSFFSSCRDIPQDE